MSFLKTLLFTVFVPGVTAGVVPRILPRWWIAAIGPVRHAGWAILAAGAAIYLWCAWDFARSRGTPLPVDPPKELVARGLYRLVRNPMYVGVLAAIVGQAILLESGFVAAYAVLLGSVFHLFVTLYEEPHLRKTFGNAYEEYCGRVGRWWPRDATLAARWTRMD